MWPLSGKRFPQEVVPLIDNKSPLQLTLDRVAQADGDSAVPGVIFGGAEDHCFLVAKAMQAAKIKGQIILEPLARKEHSSHHGAGSSEGCTARRAAGLPNYLKNVANVN